MNERHVKGLFQQVKALKEHIESDNGWIHASLIQETYHPLLSELSEATQEEYTKYKIPQDVYQVMNPRLRGGGTPIYRRQDTLAKISMLYGYLINLVETFDEKNEPAELALSGTSYIDPERIQSLRKIKSEEFDFTKTIRICEEINHNFDSGNYISTITLVRTLINHIPPVFGKEKFTEVVNNYSGGKSFTNLIKKLETDSRNLADSHLHQVIRESESLPSATQVDFSQSIDALIAEVIRIS